MIIRQFFFNIVRARSVENAKSFDLLYKHGCYGNCVSIIRQELDSYIKVLFIRNHQQKDVFINQILNGEKLRVGKKVITDKTMLSYLKPDHMDKWEEDYNISNGLFFRPFIKFS